VQSSIEANDDENYNEMQVYRVEFEDAYFSAVAICDKLMYDVNLKGNGMIEENVKNSSANFSSCCGTVAQMQLGPSCVPIFSGAYNK